MIEPANHPIIPLDVAQNILHYYGEFELGETPNRFTYRLILAIAAADDKDRTRLAEGHPELVWAYEKAHSAAGIEWLRSRVKRGRGFTGEPNLFEELAS